MRDELEYPETTENAAGTHRASCAVQFGFRRLDTGTALLAALVRYAKSVGKEIVSVDFESTNLEAYGFWTRWFLPVTWSLERRVQ